MTTLSHAPVLLTETLRELAPKSGGLYVDVTLGRGGHAEAILEKTAPDGRLIGFDRDPRAIEETATRLSRFGARVTLVHAPFSELESRLTVEGASPIDGLLADLGVSSPQLDDAARGFSFRTEAPLDMRMDSSQGETARDLIARSEEAEVADILFRFGEERRSRPIARAIKLAEERGHLMTTGDLRRAVVSVLGPRRQGGIDPATRTFQALRIAVNRELDELGSLLEALPRVLRDGGVAAIISFHSLEDRMVKRTFRGDTRLIPKTKRPIVATPAEIAGNPRARSAKLRSATRAPRALDEAHA